MRFSTRGGHYENIKLITYKNDNYLSRKEGVSALRDYGFYIIEKRYRQGNEPPLTNIFQNF